MGVRVAFPRFTIFVAPQRGRPGRPLRGEDLEARERPLCWRLLAANNRDVARSATAYRDLDACLEAVAQLQGRIADAVAVAARAGRADWSWRLRLDGDEVAVSSRTYQRRLQCEAACALFVVLVRDATLDVFGPAEAHGSGSGVPSAHAPTSPAPIRAAPIRSTLARTDKSGTPQP
jgi:uncharacterized protein YegP (UPF0339 family)